MNTGQQAEQAVTDYLFNQGYKIISRNWRNKLAEIDIVASKNKIIYLTEVKYRSSVDYGSGLEYITPKKLSKMRLGAELWVSCNNWEGDYQLLAVSVSGANFEQIEIIELET